LLQSLYERREAGLCYQVIRDRIYEHADAPHPLALLRTRDDRPRQRRTAKQRDELAPPDHSITSSAATSRPAGTVRPSALAVLRLMAVSNLVGC
jgi:hypothetical protein